MGLVGYVEGLLVGECIGTFDGKSLIGILLASKLGLCDDASVVLVDTYYELG